jgi:hypothetical protein
MAQLLPSLPPMRITPVSPSLSPPPRAASRAGTRFRHERGFHSKSGNDSTHLARAGTRRTARGRPRGRGTPPPSSLPPPPKRASYYALRADTARGRPPPVTRNAPASLHYSRGLKQSVSSGSLLPSLPHRIATDLAKSNCYRLPLSLPPRPIAVELPHVWLAPIHARIGGQGGAVATLLATYLLVPLNWHQLFLVQLIGSCRGMVLRYHKAPRRH